MIPLVNKANTDPVSAAYPYGNIKDDTGSNDGTSVDKINHADFHQFFARMMAISLVVPNNLPDNATNGFQYFVALQRVIAQEALVQGAEQSNFFTICNPVFNTYGWSGVQMEHPLSEGGDVLSTLPRYRKDAVGRVKISGQFNRFLAFDANYGFTPGNWFLFMTLPAGYRPRRSATYHLTDETWVKISPGGQLSLFSLRVDEFSVSLDGMPAWFAFQ